MDKDGSLQLVEVIDGLNVDNETEGKGEFEAMLREIDLDNNSQIDASEMPAFLQKMEELEGEEEDTESEEDEGDLLEEDLATTPTEEELPDDDEGFLEEEVEGTE